MILMTLIDFFVLKPMAKIYALSIGRVLKARAKAKRIAEMKKAKTLDDFIEIALRRGYEYPIAWADYQIMKREEWAERKKQEIELRNSAYCERN